MATWTQEMKRALFIHAKLNPGLKYVQGMNELLAPLYYVFKTDPAEPEDAEYAEADAFFCFIQLLEVSENRDLYCKALDKSQSGTRATLDQYASPAISHDWLSHPDSQVVISILKQCSCFGRNTDQVTPKITCFHYLKNYFWIKVTKKTICLILKTDAQKNTAEEYDSFSLLQLLLYRFSF